MNNAATRAIRFFLITLSFVFITAFNNVAKAQDIEAGGKLFKQNCAACHKVDKKAIGPALGGVTERRDQEWLLRWVRNNQELRESGDADAIAIYEEFNGSAMPAYPQFSDDDILNILAYVESEWAAMQAAPVAAEGGDGAVAAADGGAGAASGPGLDVVYVLGGVVAFLLIITYVLVRIKNMLLSMQGREPKSLVDDAIGYANWFSKNKTAIVIVAIIGGVIGVNYLWAGMTSIGVDQNYQPKQPIAFSHELHAGQNEIDCNYCHSSARHSAMSGIPSANVCMNCHMYIQEGPEYGTTEIQKIYDAVGWDPSKMAYKEDYETKPIEWVRIHNLPDLAYFNHSQHVVAGQVECQTCHGPIEEMKEVYQYSPLTMGWCINCHRETEVKMADNAYYDKLHDELKEKYKGEKITVEMIGGLECGKCHY